MEQLIEKLEAAGLAPAVWENEAGDAAAVVLTTPVNREIYAIDGGFYVYTEGGVTRRFRSADRLVAYCKRA